MKKKLSILLAGVCLTAALYSAGTTYGQNKTNSAKQKEDTVTTNKYQGVTIKDKTKGKVTKQQVRELKKNTPVKMRKTSLSGKQKKRNRGERNVNTRSNYTTYHSSYWSGTIYSYI